VLAWLAGSPESWLHARLWQKVAHLAGLVVAGAAVYFGALYAMGIRLAHFDRREAGGAAAPPDFGK
jgi:putative peptidoglycan lipid II flippase